MAEIPRLRLTSYPGYELYQQYANDKEKLAQLKALWQYARDVARLTDIPGLRLTPYPGHKLYQQYVDNRGKLAQLKALW